MEQITKLKVNILNSNTDAWYINAGLDMPVVPIYINKEMTLAISTYKVKCTSVYANQIKCVYIHLSNMIPHVEMN